MGDNKSTSDIRDFFIKRKRSEEVENSSADINNVFDTLVNKFQQHQKQQESLSPVKKKIKQDSKAYKPKPKRFKENEDVFRIRIA